MGKPSVRADTEDVIAEDSDGSAQERDTSGASALRTLGPMAPCSGAELGLC